MVDAFEQKPAVAEDTPEYLEFWDRVIERHKVDLILPGIESDVFFFDQHRDRFKERQCVLALNSPSLIQLAKDKLLLGLALEKISYPTIPACQPDSWREAIELLGPPPLLLKPLQGNASRGIVQIENASDFDYWRKKVNYPWMLQRIVGKPETEYTVGAFGLGNQNILRPIIFRRRLSPTGNTQEAEVMLDCPLIESAVKKLCAHFQPQGPTNLQFRVEGKNAYLLEINPRFSSSNSLRTEFGFNEAAMAIDFYLDHRIPDNPVIREGTAWRYFEDYIVYAGDPV